MNLPARHERPISRGLYTYATDQPIPRLELVDPARPSNEEVTFEARVVRCTRAGVLMSALGYFAWRMAKHRRPFSSFHLHFRLAAACCGIDNRISSTQHCIPLSNRRGRRERGRERNLSISERNSRRDLVHFSFLSLSLSLSLFDARRKIGAAESKNKEFEAEVRSIALFLERFWFHFSSLLHRAPCSLIRISKRKLEAPIHPPFFRAFSRVYGGKLLLNWQGPAADSEILGIGFCHLMASSANPSGNPNGNSRYSGFRGPGNGSASNNRYSANGGMDHSGPSQTLKYDPGQSAKWTAVDQALLEEALCRYATDSNIVRYAKIAMLLEDKSVRDVAMSCWKFDAKRMVISFSSVSRNISDKRVVNKKKESGKRRKDEHMARRNSDKKEIIRKKTLVHGAARSSAPPCALQMLPMESDDGISLQGGVLTVGEGASGDNKGMKGSGCICGWHAQACFEDNRDEATKRIRAMPMLEKGNSGNKRGWKGGM
ncbi:hypothetical protein ACLOJK_011746 [Asimina triloba]